MPLLSPPEERRRLDLAEAVARKWNSASLDYAVVHGLESYPTKLGRDLDIVIPRQSVRPAVVLAIEAGRAHGFDTPLFRWSHWGLFQLALLDRDASVAVAFDLLCTTRVWRAKWIPLVDEALLDQLVTGDGHAGPFAVSTAGRFLKSFVRPVLCGDLSRIGAAREWSLPVSVPPTLDRELIAEVLVDQTVAEPASGELLQRRWIGRHPVGALRSLLDAGVGRLQRLALDPAACLVVRTPPSRQVLVGLEALAREAGRLFVDVRLAFMPASPMRRLTHSLGVWRQPSTSEFAVTLVVDAQPNGHGSRTPRLQPAAEVVLPEPLSAAEVRQTVRTSLLGFLAATYSPARFVAAAPTEERAP